MIRSRSIKSRVVPRGSRPRTSQSWGSLEAARIPPLGQSFRVQGLGFRMSHRDGHRGAQTALARDIHLARDKLGLGFKDIRLARVLGFRV